LLIVFTLCNQVDIIITVHLYDFYLLTFLHASPASLLLLWMFLCGTCGRSRERYWQNHSYIY